MTAAATAATAVAVVLIIGALLIAGAERVTAATARNRVRVIDLERACQHVILLVRDCGAHQIACADRIDHNPQAVGIPHRIAKALLVVECHPVLQTGAPAAGDEDAQTIPFPVALLHHALQAKRCAFRNFEHRREFVLMMLNHVLLNGCHNVCAS